MSCVMVDLFNLIPILRHDPNSIHEYELSPLILTISLLSKSCQQKYRKYANSTKMYSNAHLCLSKGICCDM